MTTMPSFSLRMLLGLAIIPSLAWSADPGFVSLFDGRTLNGWAATNMADWSVQDGTITARSTTPVANHSYLIWQGGQPADFELKATFRILGAPQANSGIQVRSRVRPDGFVEGYQADIARYADHCGILYDEVPGRGLLAERGQRVVIDEPGQRAHERFAEAADLFQRIRLDDWNEYHIVARGPTVSARINGALMWEVTDRERRRHAEAPGVIALQIHSGPPMTVQFKELWLKDLTAAALQPHWPFFALCMDTHDAKKRTLPEQAALLKELGYAGAGHLWLEQVPERLQSLEAAGLKLFQIYVRVSIAADAKPPYDARLKEILPRLKDREVMLAVLLVGGKPSDPAPDARAVALLRELAGLAQPFGVKLALYPHAGDWLERVEDALRVLRQVDRPNVGVMFNLCHWLKVDDEQNLAPLLQAARPHLFAVSLNGADHAADIRAGKGDWLQPLGQGAFDLLGFLKRLKALDYTGPIGLQCWGLPGDARDHLTRSMAAWREMNGKLE